MVRVPGGALAGAGGRLGETLAFPLGGQSYELSSVGKAGAPPADSGVASP